jgi:hypothetical protein
MIGTTTPQQTVDTRYVWDSWSNGGAMSHSVMPTVDTSYTANFIGTSIFATVSGRVLTPDGRGLRNSVVSITDANLVRRTVTTSSFGFYSFDNVVTGQTYTMRVASKLYRFTSRTIDVNDNLTNVDFFGLE